MLAERYEDEVAPLFKILKRKDFGFFVVFYNYKSLSNRLVEEIKAKFPDRKATLLNCRHTTFSEILECYETQGEGMLFLDNFQDVLELVRDSDGNLLEESATENERRRDIVAGLNLRRDRLIKLPVSLFILIGPMSTEYKGREAMESMPDMWSMRTWIVDLDRFREEVSVDTQHTTRSLPGETTGISSLGGNTEAEKREELQRLQKAFGASSDLDVSLRLGYAEQILTLLRELDERESISHWQQIRNEIAHSSASHTLNQEWFQELSSLAVPELPDDVGELEHRLSNLPENGKQLLSIFSVLPSEPIPLSLLAMLLSEMDGLPKTLRLLAMEGWLDRQQDPPSLRISPVVQEIVLHKHRGRLFADCELFVDALIDKLKSETSSGHPIHVSYAEAADLVRWGAAMVPRFPEPENKVGILCDRIGRFYMATGDLDKALEAYQNSLGIDKELHEAFPGDAEFKNNLAISYQHLGITHTALGDLDRALEAYQDYNRLKKELHEDFYIRLDFKNGLAISYQYLGNTYTALGDLDRALEAFQEYHRLEMELHEAFPGNVDFKNGLATAYSKLGNTHTALGDLDSALEAYQEDLRLSKELHEAFPGNVDFKNGLAISYQYLGNTYTALGDLDRALESYRELHRLESELHEAFPGNVEFKNGLAISYFKLGNTHTALRDLDRALEAYQEYHRLEMELHEAFPGNVGYKNNLAISYQYLGDTHTALGDLDRAMEAYQEDLRLSKELHEAFPSNVDFKNGLAVSHVKLGEFYQSEHPSIAIPHFQAAEKLWEELVADAPGFVVYRKNLDAVRGVLAKMGA